MAKKKKRMAKRDKMLVACVVSIMTYTIASFVLQFATTVEISPTLTSAFFLFWTAEIWTLSKITRDKVKSKIETDTEEE